MSELLRGKPRARWYLLPLGMPAFAAFVICVVTGVLLVPVYKPGLPFDSVAMLLLKNPAGAYMRSLHYWSAQAFLVLTMLHVLDHWRRRSETRIGFGIWGRLALSIPAVVAVMLTGFLLRGDVASTQALNVLRSLLSFVPFVGAVLVRILTGSGPDRTAVYLHHAATLTILIWLVTIEHARRLLPRATTTAQMLPPLLALSFFLVPGLGWRATAIEKGPWYLVGLQELLHWMARPAIAVWLMLLSLLVFILLPKFPRGFRPWIRGTMAIAAGVYALLSVMGIGFRGEGWRLQSPLTLWKEEPHALSFRSYTSPDPKLLAINVPIVEDHREGCLACHAVMTGFVPAHDPKTVGCASCHLGNPLTLNPALAHAGMTLTPGNLTLANRTCGDSNCHAEVLTRVQGSLMNTMSGVIAVDKFAFGESADLNAHFEVARLGTSAADTHLRQLCASCHLGQDKEKPAPIDDSSRGGGCSACHLRYDPAAAAELGRRGGSLAPQHHPDVSIQVAPQACFGCHSRSGRIATNYEGWHETQLEEPAAKARPGWPSQFRVLGDGRVFAKRPADIHFEKGMTCVDCHLAAEVMSDGTAHSHEREAVRVACIDCHAAGATPARDFAQLDPETQQIVAMRRFNVPGRRFVASPGGAAHAGTFLGPDGRPRLSLLESGRLLEPRVAAAVCTGPAHARLTCEACHTSWAPQCIGCHTSFDPRAQGWDHLAGKLVKGAWQEDAANFEGDAPALGVETATQPDGQNTERITTFAPGMVMRLELPTGAKAQTRFLRLYAPVSPHTTPGKARDCRSCHANPAALGYGRGKLTYVVQGNTAEWKFLAAYPASPADGLPEDAWIGFLREPGLGTTTRKGARPFSLQEQRLCLLVGACLSCHTGKEPRIVAVFADFKHYRRSLRAECTLPAWADAAVDQAIARTGTGLGRMVSQR